MASITLDAFAKAFGSEAELRGALAELLAQVPHTSDIKITHGAQEYGKDLVFRARGGLQEQLFCACVVKNTRISGSVDANQGAMTILHQAKQCLTHPYLNSKGEEERVDRVYVISPHECSQITMKSIEGELEHRSGQIVFVCGRELLRLFESHLPGFLLLQSGLLTKYLAVLKHQYEEDGPMGHLAFKHGILAKARRSSARVYVRPQFHKEVPEFEFAKPPALRLDSQVTHSRMQEVEAAVAARQTAISSLSQSWLSGQKAKDAARLADSLETIRVGVTRAWETAYEAYARGCKRNGTRALGQNQVQLLLPSDALGESTKTILGGADALINDFAAAVKEANTYATVAQTDPTAALHGPRFLQHARIWDVARTASSPLRVKKKGQTLRFAENLLATYNGDLLITAPAGYGKTSFCKWSALNDAEQFTDGTTVVVPVYVPVHQFARKEIGSFSETFLPSDEIAGLLEPQQRGRSESRIRLYIDGLDEIPHERQQKLMEVAREGSRNRPDLQVVVTGRDHVYGPWLDWLTRISLSPLSDRQVKTLVAVLLEDDDAQVISFFQQLDLVPSLEPLMKIPLLGTLIVSVYRNMTTLPEGKTELYRIFVDLLCGGWDTAKGVKRESEFGATLKLRVLIRLASVLHQAKTRVGTIAPFNLDPA